MRTKKQSVYLVCHFWADICNEVIVSWVESTGKHQVLPYHQSQPISQLIELLRLIDLQCVHHIRHATTTETTHTKQTDSQYTITVTFTSCNVLLHSFNHSQLPMVLGLWVRKSLAENFRKFILVFPEISRNLLIIITWGNRLFPSPALQSDAVKEACSWQTTLQIFLL